MQKKAKISIRTQLFVALSTVILAMAAVFSPYGFYTNVSSIRESVDSRLTVAVYGLNELIPPDYHDRVARGEVSKAQYEELVKKSVEFKRKIGLTWLYAMVETPDGKIRFTLDEEVPLMSEYENPSPDTVQAFSSKKTVCAQGEDVDFGMVSRTVLIPFRSPEGRLYIIGADLNESKIAPLIVASISGFVAILGAGILFVALLTVVLSKRISLPIRALSDFMKKLANSDFSPELELSSTLPPSMMKADEVAVLAYNIEVMRTRLGEYIANLKRETDARSRVESELEIAGGIQESFLPGTSFETAFVSASASMRPAKQAGGDLYDFFNLSDGRICFAIGDTSGKGMPAALFMARAITLIRSAAYIGGSLSAMVQFINDMLSDSNDSCMFITFFIFAYDEHSGEVEFVNCGHNPPYIRRADGSVSMMKPKTNSILGVFGGKIFEAEKLGLGVGDSILCYTDGVTEAIAEDDSFYGEKRLEMLLQKMPKDSAPKDYVKAVNSDVSRFADGCEQSDDITILSVSRKK